MSKHIKTFVSCGLMLLMFTSSKGQAVSGTPSSTAQTNLPAYQEPLWRFTTEAYNKEAARLLIVEANQIARELKLSETLPVTLTNVVELFVPPPSLGFLGTMATSNYVYYFASGRKFTGVDVMHHGESWPKVKSDYKNWPISLLDTNAAFKAGLEIMKSASADVAGLAKDCTIELNSVLPEGEHGKHFIPDYWIHWRKGEDCVAYLEFIYPTRSVRQLHVYDPKYMLSKRVEIPNLRELLMEGNPPPELLHKMGLDGTNTTSKP